MDLTCCRVHSSHHVAWHKGRGQIHRALLPPHPPGDLSMDAEHWTQPMCQQEPAPFPFSSFWWIIPSSYQAAVDKWKNLPLCLSTTSNVRFNHISPVICVPRLAPETVVQVQGSCDQHPFPVVSSGAGGAQLWKQGHFSALALFLEPVTALPFTATKPGIGV